MIVTLDRLSAEAETDIALWSAHSSYLQHLLGFRPAKTSEKPLHSPRVAMPVRLLDRLDDSFLGPQDNADHQLGAAVMWEIAALVAGRTISEWAYQAVAFKLFD